MSRQSISVLALTLGLTGTVVANRFVTGAGVQTAAGGNALGVAVTDGVAGENIPVTHLGTEIVEAGAVIAANALVESDASGRAIPHSAGTILGRMAPTQSAAAAGEFVEVIQYQN